MSKSKTKSVAPQNVKNLKYKQTGDDGYYRVSSQKCLYVKLEKIEENPLTKLKKGGAKYWLYRYTQNKHVHWLGLGAVKDVEYSAIQEIVLEYEKIKKSGADLKNHHNSKKQNAGVQSLITFEQCAEKYIEHFRGGWKNKKHIQQWKNTIKTYAVPSFGKLGISQIDRIKVKECLETIWQTKPETATRLRGRLEKIFDYAIANGWFHQENPARWKPYLVNMLLNPSTFQIRKHQPALPYEDMPEFINSLQSKEGISFRALEFLILTACRSGEVRGAKWEEFDYVKKTWTIPAVRMKSRKVDGKPHVVALSEKAIALIQNIPIMQNSPHVFTGRSGAHPISDATMLQVTKRMKIEGVPHGFRSTFKDWASEITDYPNELSEMALAHKISDKVEEAYRRGNLLKKRYAMMNDWASYCYSVFNSDSVKSKEK